MRFAIYILAGLLVIGLGVGAFSYNPSDEISRDTSPVREVFVDINKLVELHPSYGAVADMNATLADVRVRSNATSMSAPSDRERSHSAGLAVAPEGRRKLVADAAKSATDGLAKMEADQREALQARLRVSRAAMMESADVEMKTKALEIEQSAVDSQQLIARDHAPDRLKAQLKAMALRAASKSLGVDPAAAALRAGKAQAEVTRIDSVSAVAEDDVETQARARIDQLRAAAKAKTDAELAAYENGEDRRIERSTVTARDQIAKEMASFSGMPAGWGTVARGKLSHGSAASAPQRMVAHGPGDAALTVLREQAVRADAQIRQDVQRAVLRFAKERGVSVRFSLSGRRLPDETRVFSTLMREHALDACGPVLTQPRGT